MGKTRYGVLYKRRNYLEKSSTWDEYDKELFLVISTLAFTMWLRIDEALSMKFDYVKMNTVDDGNIHEIRLPFRKTDKTDNEGEK